jgi:hypothetical protein
VPTSGNPSVKRLAPTKLAALPDFTGKCGIGRLAVNVMRAPYYCIATGQELWFERLDSTRSSDLALVLPMYLRRLFVRWRIMQHFSLSGGVL